MRTTLRARRDPSRAGPIMPRLAPSTGTLRRGNDVRESLMAVVLITGCSTGIGLETALAFARRGDTTIATMRNVAKADALKKRAAR